VESPGENITHLGWAATARLSVVYLPEDAALGAPRLRCVLESSLAGLAAFGHALHRSTLLTVNFHQPRVLVIH
jgi:hypothetical protein